MSRAGADGPPKDFGGFWSRDAPTGVAQVRKDEAILPTWRGTDGNVTGTSPLNHGYAASSRSGTPMYKGRVAPQTGDDGHVYAGGTPQVHIPESYKHGSVVDEWGIF